MYCTSSFRSDGVTSINARSEAQHLCSCRSQHCIYKLNHFCFFLVSCTMILDDKALLNPPPPYSYDILSHSNLSSIDRDGETASSVGDNNPYHSARKSKPMFSSLPSHLLLQIVYCTFPWKDGQFEGDVKEVLQRRTLYWLETSLRFVNRDLYIGTLVFVME